MPLPVSSAVQVTVTFSMLNQSPLFGLVIVTVGACVSTVNITTSKSTFPALSTAITVTLWSPFGTPVKVWDVLVPLFIHDPLSSFTS